MSAPRNQKVVRPRRIAVMMPREYRFGREIILGAAKYCMTHGMSLLHLGVVSPEELDDPRKAEAEGVISYAANPAMADKFRKWGLPLVSTSSRFSDAGTTAVLADNVRVGQQGAQHLIDRGFRSLAYLGIAGHWYSQLRGDGFRAVASAAGIDCRMTDDVSFDLSDRPQESSMAAWLKALPLPIGLMCCNDIRSRHVLEICRVLHLRVPQDVAILGCDNDEVICQGMDPMLSSVDPNAYRIGYEAASVLARMLQGRKVEDRTLVPPLGVVPRASTYTTPAADPTIAIALNFIHDKSEEPLGVREIAARVGMSRRTLERKFEKHVGWSIATAIRRAHIERAKQLLIDTDISLEEVAEASGLKYVRQLRIAFLRETGSSPSQFRRSFQRLS